jgi:hypothetical protein
VHIVLAQAIFRQGIQVESLYRAALAAKLSITGIIKYNEKHIRRTLLSAVGFRSGWFGNLIHAVNHSVEGAAGFVLFERYKISPYLDILGLAVLQRDVIPALPV